MNKPLLLALLLLPLTAAAQGRPAAVEITKAELRQLAPRVVATGQVQSRSGGDMAAGIAGRLDWVAEPGASVKKGEAIARMDAGELRLARAEQAARVVRNQVALKQSDRELERLRASGTAVSRYQLDQAENTRDLTAADLEIAQATLRQTDERLSRTEVRAPYAGIVSERLRREGEEVVRGDVIARLHDTEHLEIRLFLPLRHVRAIAPGSIVTLQLGDDQIVDARIRAIVPVGDARTQSFETLIDAPQMDPPLAVGRSVRIELPLEAARQALAVPRDAVVIRTDGMAVYKMQKDGKSVVRVPVKTGVAEGTWVAVEGALSPNDDVVVRGAESLHDGDPVTVIGTKPV